ncbi:MAG: universal stress protein [Nitrososphaeraceae archaeon]|nr:universal stress protein [Nitrososphaeraceae archaeon]
MDPDKPVPKSTSSSESDTLENQTSSSSLPSIQYSAILVPHDGSELSDRALGHACYLSKLSGAEIIILNVIEHVKNTDSSALTVTSKEGPDKSNENVGITLDGGLKEMVDRKIRLCKQSGVKSQISYKIQTDRPPYDEIISLSEEKNVDLIVMASSRISSSIKVFGSITRKVIDNAKKPVLVIHEHEQK